MRKTSDELQSRLLALFPGRTACVGPPSPARRLTGRQKDIIEFIRKFRDQNGYPPTFREICNAFGISQNCVYCHVSSMIKKGFINKDPVVSRSIRIAGETALYVPDRYAEKVRAYLRSLEKGGVT
jgi:SOS-response transcriptional repressor LexA